MINKGYLEDCEFCPRYQHKNIKDSLALTPGNRSWPNNPLSLVVLVFYYTEYSQKDRDSLFKAQKL